MSNTATLEIEITRVRKNADWISVEYHYGAAPTDTARLYLRDWEDDVLGITHAAGELEWQSRLNEAQVRELFTRAEVVNA